MSQLYSNADDCHKLALLLNNELKGKIEFMGSTYQEVVGGKFHSFRLNDYKTYRDYEKEQLGFDYKFCEDGFLRVTIDEMIHSRSLGHKLAALSDIYVVLKKIYGEPTVFYTTKNDDTKGISMQWSFVQREEDIKAFKENTVFDDDEIDTLVVFNEPQEKTSTYTLNDKTKQIIVHQVGLPFELLPLVDENIEDYVYYKFGKEMTYPENAKIEGYNLHIPERNPIRIRK